MYSFTASETAIIFAIFALLVYYLLLLIAKHVIFIFSITRENW